MAQEIHFRIVEKDKEEAIPGALIVYNNDEHQMSNWKGESVAVLKNTSSSNSLQVNVSNLEAKPWRDL